MTDVVFAVPGSLQARTGGYAYARKLLKLVPEYGINLSHLPLPGGFPHPTREELAAAAKALAAVNSVLMVDGLAYGALPAAMLSTLRAPLVPLVHHPLALETGLDAATQAKLFASEAAALRTARSVVSSSKLTARLLQIDYGVPAERIAIAEPGNDPAPRASGTGGPVTLLAVGAVSPRKGFDILVAALSTLADVDWRLTIAGSLERSPEAVAALRTAIAESGLAHRVTLAGAVDEAALDGLYDAADIVVSPSLFEGYGMVLTEAMARGLPLVASTGGAADETMPDEVGLKVPPGDVGALAAALRAMTGDPALRKSYAEAAWAAGQKLPRWSDTAAKVAAVLKALA